MAAYLDIGYVSAAWLVVDEPERAIREASSVFERWPQVANDMQRYYAAVACTQAELYRGDPRSALERMRALVPRLRRTFLMRIQIVRSNVHHLVARAAVAVLAREPGDRAARADAERSVRALGREDLVTARAFSRSMSGSLAMVEGRRGEAANLFAEAAAQFDGLSMALYAAATRFRQAECLGEHGLGLRKAAEEFMLGETIRVPARMVDVLVPGGLL